MAIFTIKKSKEPPVILDSEETSCTTEVIVQETNAEDKPEVVETEDKETQEVVLEEQPQLQTEQPEYQIEDISVSIYYPTIDLNCRVSPDINTDRITTFSRGAKLTATKKSKDGWYYVSNGTYEGWCNGYYLSTSKPAPKPESTNNATTTTSPTGSNSAVFKLTAYCACPKCCGKWANGITATGTTATQGRTIAVYPSQIPLGSTVYIEGYGAYVAEDTGVGYGVIDVYFNSHTEALNFGVRYATVTW